MEGGTRLFVHGRDLEGHGKEDFRVNLVADQKLRIPVALKEAEFRQALGRVTLNLGSHFLNFSLDVADLRMHFLN
jgi:hypothetical protein